MKKFKTFIGKQLAKKELKKAFKNAGLYNKRKNGDHEVKLFPKIQNVSLNQKQQTITYTFTLLNGMDPKEVKKKEYVFLQHFGTNIDIEGDVKKFVLTVHMQSLSKEYTYNYPSISKSLEPFQMPIVCGKNSSGDLLIYDAITEPNCLVSGEPGAGKSTQVRSIISTLIQYKTPDELHIYLGDLKLSEFFLFKGIKHVKSVCIYESDMEKMLNHLHRELKRRGELLNRFEVTHVKDLPKDEKIPYILLAIDEIVMIMDNKEMKKQLVQLVSLGRALGIYCILSLQRPSHDILDTKIRGLLTVRMGFRTTDFSNSRIIGTPGSEKISKETPGRFLIKRDELTELQAPYLTDLKAKELLAPYKDINWKDQFVRDPYEGEKSPVEITEKDVFLDVTESTR